MLLETIVRSVYDHDPCMEVLLYIIQHTDPFTMEFSKTYDHIEKDLHVSRATIASTINKLSSGGLITKVGRGVWRNNMVGDLDDPYEGIDLLSEHKG